MKVAAEIGVKEVYLQRLVFFEEGAVGLRGRTRRSTNG